MNVRSFLVSAGVTHTSATYCSDSNLTLLLFRNPLVNLSYVAFLKMWLITEQGLLILKPQLSYTAWSKGLTSFHEVRIWTSNDP